MGYYLGIDLGTTYTAAAVWRDGRAEISTLGLRGPVVPSLVFLRDDAQLLFGEAAERRAVSDPGRVAREFKRRMGDTTPLLLGGTPYSSEALTSKLLRWVVDKVTESEGGPPDGVALTHPANWGDYKKDLLEHAVRLADLSGVALLTEPEAAAVHYSSFGRVPTGATIAVYDLGGGTFDAAVLRKVPDGWELLGEPSGVERLGGVDFDQAVFHHVERALDWSAESIDTDDRDVLAAVAGLRHECVAAKEALSSDTEATIRVWLPNLQSFVRLTRSEFEDAVRPRLADSVAALRRAVRSAGIEPDDLTSVLLVGGSSRIPLVAQVVGSELGRAVATDAHPKHAVALGAAIYAASVAEPAAALADALPPPAPETPPPPPLTPPPPPTAPAAPPPAAPAGDTSGLRPPPDFVTTPPAATNGGRRRILVLAGTAGLVAAVAVAAIVLLLSGGDDDPETVDAGSSTLAQGESVAVSVAGTDDWTDTGIDLQDGDQVRISAAGTVFHNEEMSTGPDGDDSVRGVEGPLGEDHHSALIGRIGDDGEPFLVGSAADFQADGSGRLWLGINDPGVDNNDGSFDAEIAVD